MADGMVTDAKTYTAPQYTLVNTSGTQTIGTAGPNHKIRILGCVIYPLTATAPGTYTFNTSTGPTAITGVYNLATAGVGQTVVPAASGLCESSFGDTVQLIATAGTLQGVVIWAPITRP